MVHTTPGTIDFVLRFTLSEGLHEDALEEAKELGHSDRERNQPSQVFVVGRLAQEYKADAKSLMRAYREGYTVKG